MTHCFATNHHCFKMGHPSSGTTLAFLSLMKSKARNGHVTHLIQSFEIGGLEIMVQRLAQATLEAGFDVEVLAYLEDGPLRQEMEKLGIKAHFLAAGRGLSPQLPFRIARHLIRSHTSILHTHHLGPYAYGALASVFLKLPHVHTDHSHEFYDRPRRRWIGRSMPRLAQVVSVSNEVEEFRRRALGVSGRVIPNGVPIPENSESQRRACFRAGLDPQKRYIGCVARLAAEKDPFSLIRAFRIFAERNPNLPHNLVFIGEGQMESLIEKLDLTDRVLLMGKRSDVNSILPALDLFVLPSLREGLSLALLEAMAASIPFVCTAVGEHGRVARSGGGILVETQDPEALAVAMAYVTFSETQRLAMGNAAQQWVKENGCVQHMAQQYVDLYREAMAAS
jgi:glycosyltransferase involved in cell wall biosynthesis